VVMSTRASQYSVYAMNGSANSNAQSFSVLAGSATASSPLQVGAFNSPNSSGRFSDPFQMWVRDGYAYITDLTDSVIKRMLLSTGAVTTIAGSPGDFGSTDGSSSGARFGEPAGIWSDGTNVYVTDAYFDTVRKISIATGQVTTLAGSPDNPSG